MRWVSTLVLTFGCLLHAEINSGRDSSDDLPDAPSQSARQQESPGAQGSSQKGLKSPSLLYLYPGRITSYRLTTGDKWKMYSRATFGPRSLVTPTIGAAIRLGSSRDRYPEAWQPSWGGFGRQYGNSLAIQGAQNTAYYGASWLLHEDPRYAPSESKNGAARIGHALLFTFIDRGDAGGSRPAIANFVGAAAGGFIGNAYLPAGFNDATHAGQRSLVRFGIYGGTNLLREFNPELMQLARKLHLGLRGGLPIPVWWTPQRPVGP